MKEYAKSKVSGSTRREMMIFLGLADFFLGIFPTSRKV